MEFFAYWNGAQIRDLFEAVASITATGDFLGLLRTAALLGLLCTLTVCALRYRGLDAMSYVFAIALFYGVTLVPKTDITIRDERAGTVYVVSHVPLGVAFMASTSSHIGHWLTHLFESTFAAVEAERFSSFGMVFPQRAVNALLSAGPLTPQGQTMVSDFNRYCIVPELVDRTDKINELTASGNLWRTVSAAGWVNPARKTTNADGNWIGCDEAVTALENYLNQVEIPAIEKHLAMKLLPDHADPSAVILRALPQAESLLLGVSESLSASIKHSVFLNTIDADLTAVAALSKNPMAVATQLAKAQGNLASEINYRTMAQIAQDALPKIRNALEFVIIAAFPLIFILMIAIGHMAASLLRNYFTLLIWVQLWAPICAVINYLIIHVDAHPMNRIIAHYGADSLLAVGVIREMGASSQAIAGFLTILAPVIAFAIAKGSDIASAQMVGSLMAPAQGAAQAQGSTLASGSIAIGNVSWGNVSTGNRQGHKTDFSSAWSDSAMMKSTSAYGSVTRAGDGTVTGLSATPVSMGVASVYSVGNNASHASQSGLSASMSHSDSVNFTQSMNSQTQSKAMTSFANMLTSEIARGSGMSEQHSERNGLALTNSASSSTTLSSSLSNSEGSHFNSSLNMGTVARGDKPGYLQKNSNNVLETSTANASALLSANPINNATDGKASAQKTAMPFLESLKAKLQEGMGEGRTDSNAGLSIQTAQQLIDTAASQETATSQSQKQTAYQTLMAASRQIAESTRDAGIKSVANAFQAQLTQAYQRANQSGFSQEATQSASRQRGFVSNQDIRTLMDNNPMAIQKAIDTFGSAENAQSALFHSAAARLAFAEKLQQDFSREPYIPDFGKPQTPEAVDALGAENKQSFKSQTDADFAKADEALHLDGKLSQQSTGLREPGQEPNKDPVRHNSASIRNSIGTELQNSTDELMVQRGSIRSAKAIYDEKQSGLPTVANNALLGGFLYDAPRDYANRLEDQSLTDSHTREAMKTLGKQKADVSIRDFEYESQKNE